MARKARVECHMLYIAVQEPSLDSLEEWDWLSKGAVPKTYRQKGSMSRSTHRGADECCDLDGDRSGERQGCFGRS